MPEVEVEQLFTGIQNPDPNESFKSLGNEIAPLNHSCFTLQDKEDPEHNQFCVGFTACIELIQKDVFGEEIDNVEIWVKEEEP